MKKRGSHGFCPTAAEAAPFANEPCRRNISSAAAPAAPPKCMSRNTCIRRLGQPLASLYTRGTLWPPNTPHFLAPSPVSVLSACEGFSQISPRLRQCDWRTCGRESLPFLSDMSCHLGGALALAACLAWMVRST